MQATATATATARGDLDEKALEIETNDSFSFDGADGRKHSVYVQVSFDQGIQNLIDANGSAFGDEDEDEDEATLIVNQALFQVAVTLDGVTIEDRDGMQGYEPDIWLDVSDPGSPCWTCGGDGLGLSYAEDQVRAAELGVDDDDGDGCDSVDALREAVEGCADEAREELLPLARKFYALC